MASLNDELSAAAHVGDIARVTRLLRQPNLNINAHNPTRDTPLLGACLGGHGAVVTALLRAGADPNIAYAFGAAPLAIAAERGDVRIVEELLAAGARVDRTNTWGATALHAAASGGFANVVTQLLAAGADPSVRDRTGATPLHEAKCKNHVDVVQVLEAQGGGRQVPRLPASGHGSGRSSSSPSPLKSSNTSTSLDRAVSSGDVHAVQALVRSGVSLKTVSKDRSTVLHRAVNSKYVEMVEYLLRQDVDIDAVDAAGWSALHHAVRTRCVEIVKVLVHHGADMNLQTKGRRGEPTTRYEATALHLAIRADDMKILSILVACDQIDLNLRNEQGRTPLVYAVSLDKSEAVKLLLTAGADVNMKADAGESALLVASFRGRTEDIHALLAAGARTDVVARSGRTPLNVAKVPEQRQVIELYHRSQQFHDKSFVCLSGQGTAPTIDNFNELVPLITSVYDLRHILTLVVVCDPTPTTAATRTLLNDAFHHIVSQKLTYDDKACVFFKLCLEKCEKDKLLPHEDVLLLDRLAEKVNTENSTWVLEMKKQVYVNSWRLDGHDKQLHAVTNGLKEIHAMVKENREVVIRVSRRVQHLQDQVEQGKKLVMQLRNRVHHVSKDIRQFEHRLSQGEANLQKVATGLQNFREAYVNRLQQEERNQKIKRVINIVASVAGFVFAPLLKEVGGAIVDFVNPIEIVHKVYGGDVDIAGFLSDKSREVLPVVIRSQLEKYAIPPDEFETLLREEIVLQHPEYIDECTQRGLTLSVDGGRSDTARELEPTLLEQEPIVPQLVGELQALVLASPERSLELPYARKYDQPESSCVRPSLGRPDNQDQHSFEDEMQKIFEATRTSTPPPPSKCSNSPIVVSNNQDTLEMIDDLDKFEFHAAVHESHGNVNEYESFIRLTDACDPNATMTMQFHTVVKAQESLCAATYAFRRGYPELGEYIVSCMQNPPVVDKSPAHAIDFVEDTEDYPFIDAVDESQGHVDEFKRFMSVYDDESFLQNTIQANVVRLTSESVQWTPLEYACHLGYEEIVKIMLKDQYKTIIPARTKFQLIKRVHERAVELMNN